MDIEWKLWVTPLTALTCTLLGVWFNNKLRDKSLRYEVARSLYDAKLKAYAEILPLLVNLFLSSRSTEPNGVLPAKKVTI